MLTVLLNELFKHRIQSASFAHNQAIMRFALDCHPNYRMVDGAGKLNFTQFPLSTGMIRFPGNVVRNGTFIVTHAGIPDDDSNRHCTICHQGLAIHKIGSWVPDGSGLKE